MMCSHARSLIENVLNIYFFVTIWPPKTRFIRGTERIVYTIRVCFDISMVSIYSSQNKRALRTFHPSPNENVIFDQFTIAQSPILQPNRSGLAKVIQRGCGYVYKMYTDAENKINPSQLVRRSSATSLPTVN